MNKKSRIGIMALVAILILAVTVSSALAATLGNLSGQSCGSFSGTWHFVNNQTDGAAAGTLTATFSDGSSHTVGATTVLAKTQHFFIYNQSGTLTGASTNLPGKLVLSDFTCTEVTKTPEPSKTPPPK